MYTDILAALLYNLAVIQSRASTKRKIQVRLTDENKRTKYNQIRLVHYLRSPLDAPPALCIHTEVWLSRHCLTGLTKVLFHRAERKTETFREQEQQSLVQSLALRQVTLYLLCTFETVLQATVCHWV